MPLLAARKVQEQHFSGCFFSRLLKPNAAYGIQSKRNSKNKISVGVQRLSLLTVYINRMPGMARSLKLEFLEYCSFDSFNFFSK